MSCLVAHRLYDGCVELHHQLMRQVLQLAQEVQYILYM